MQINLLSGRADRRTFWLVSAAAFAIRAVLHLTTGNQVVEELVVLAPLVWVWWRRLHDINISGWWSLAPAAVSFVEGFVRGWSRASRADSASTATLTSLPTSWQDAVLQHPDAFIEGFVRGFTQTVTEQFWTQPFTITLGVAMTLLLAFLPGNPAENRYGPPPNQAKHASS